MDSLRLFSPASECARRWSRVCGDVAFGAVLAAARRLLSLVGMCGR